MKDNPTLNTGVGTYHLSFPIMAGQSCYRSISSGGATARFLLGNSIQIQHVSIEGYLESGLHHWHALVSDMNGEGVC